MRVCVGKPIKPDSSYCIQHIGKGKIEVELTNVKVMIIKYLGTFLGGDLQVVYGALLRHAVGKISLSKSLRLLLDC